MNTESPFDPLSGIKEEPVKVTYSRKAWPVLIFDLAVRPIGSAPTGRHALLLALTYQGTPWAGTPNALVQPRYDVELMKDYLLSLKSAGWLESDITVLTDKKGTPEDLLPTHANIMREIRRLGKSNCQNVFFLYTGHSDQRPQPKQTMSARPILQSVRGQRMVEEFDQYIVPIDAVIGPGLTDVDQDLVIIDNVLHECLISPLPPMSTFFAILDTCHSATLLDLAHDRCHRIGTLKSILRHLVRRVVVQPFSKISGRGNGGVAEVVSFNISDCCTGYCLRRKTLLYPNAVTIAACKDQQQVYESGPSLTQTIVEVLRSKPTAGLRDIIDSVLINYKHQQKQMRECEKRLKEEGNTEEMREMHKKRVQVSRLKPQVASTAALDLSRSRSWSAFPRGHNL